MDNTSTFRRRVAGFTGEEVSIACEVLVNLHPARYLNALAQSLMKQRSEYGEIMQIIHKRNEYTKYLVGDRSEYEQEQFIAEKAPKELPTLSESEYNHIQEMLDTAEDITEKLKRKEIDIPNFIFC